jgi:uncharacterized membrane protein YozB (DUF420 family)
MATMTQPASCSLTSAVAWYCVRSGRIQQHREWMIRSHPFAMVFVVAQVMSVLSCDRIFGPSAFASVVWTFIALALFVPSILIA